jgi:hypothetical protein
MPKQPFSQEIESIKKMLLDHPQLQHTTDLKLDNTNNNHSRKIKKYFDNKSKTERIFTKSPSPLRELKLVPMMIRNDYKPIPTQVDNGGLFNENKSRHRFTKKKNIQRSHSVELPNYQNMISFKNKNQTSMNGAGSPSIVLTKPVDTKLLNKYNITQQQTTNSMGNKSKSKSLGENLNSFDNPTKRNHRFHNKRVNQTSENKYRSTSLNSTASSSSSSETDLSSELSSFSSQPQQQLQQQHNKQLSVFSPSPRPFTNTFNNINDNPEFSSDDSVCGIPKPRLVLLFLTIKLSSTFE